MLPLFGLAPPNPFATYLLYRGAHFQLGRPQRARNSDMGARRVNRIFCFEGASPRGCLQEAQHQQQQWAKEKKHQQPTRGQDGRQVKSYVMLENGAG